MSKKKRFTPKQYFLNFIHSFKKFPISLKNYFGEIVTGVVIGLIILIVTPFINNIIVEKETKQELVNNLSSVSLGMSKNYIDELFGQPIIETEYEKTVTWYPNDQSEETFISAGYKLENIVLLCLYHNKNLVAFVVVVNKAHLYRIPANSYLNDCYLLDFTYFNFSETVDIYEGNVPFNNDTFAYYFELHYGGGFSNYNYYIIGSYKDYREKTDVYDLMLLGHANSSTGDYTTPYYEEYYTLRENVQPNVFGIVSSYFSADFNFAFDIVGSRENGTLLFSDWHNY